MNISHAFANSTGASAEIIRTSSSDCASGRGARARTMVAGDRESENEEEARARRVGRVEVGRRGRSEGGSRRGGGEGEIDGGVRVFRRGPPPHSSIHSVAHA